MTDRADRLVAELDQIGDGSGADVMLVTSLVNVRYLTGYTGSNGAALIGPETRVFFTDFRYQEQSAVEVDPSFQRRIERADLLEGLADVLPAGQPRLAFEDGAMTVRANAASTGAARRSRGAGRRRRPGRAPAGDQGTRGAREDPGCDRAGRRGGT